jgi:undecaprenyl-phosphate 4-deoxy-4-formamido-L-arabinose transferase
MGAANTKKDIPLSIVIPVYNGAATIGDLVGRLTEVLAAGSFQIVLVNDGSRDRSHEVCLELSSKYPFLTYLNLSRNFGEHNAVMAGFNHADGDYTVIMDDDFQNPPEEVLRLMEEARRGKFDVVYTYYGKKRHHWLRNLGSRFNNLVANFMLEKPRDLYLSSFKCLSRFAVEEVLKYKGPFPYIDGLLLRCTGNIGKIEVSHARRKAGRSGYTPRKLIRLWLNMFLNFSVMPLRASSLLGLLFSAAGLVLSVFVVIEKLLYPDTPIGWPSLIVVIMIFSGVQLIMLGLIGEYLGRLFLSTNATPQYSVRDVYKEGTRHG